MGSLSRDCRPREPMPGRRFSIGRFSALRYRTGSCQKTNSRRCSTRCSGSPRVRRSYVVRPCMLHDRRHSGSLRMNSPPEPLDGTVDPKLLEILVCPITKGPLEFDATRQELISRSAKLAYPIRDGIPIMLPEEARKID